MYEWINLHTFINCSRKFSSLFIQTRKAVWSTCVYRVHIQLLRRPAQPSSKNQYVCWVNRWNGISSHRHHDLANLNHWLNMTCLESVYSRCLISWRGLVSDGESLCRGLATSLSYSIALNHPWPLFEHEQWKTTFCNITVQHWCSWYNMISGFVWAETRVSHSHH